MPMFDYICEVCGHEGRENRKDKPPRFCSMKCRKKGKIKTGSPKWPITPEMHDLIKSVYKSMTGNGEVRELANEFGYPRWKITRYAQQQGWIAKTRREPNWTERELRILHQSAHLTPDRIQIHLRIAGFTRSLNGIVLKRKRMRFLQNLSGQSAHSLAECFGVDVKTILRWINLGHLHARKRGTKRTAKQGGDMWFIKDRWIRDFIINYVAEIDIRKVDKYWFVDLLAGGDRLGTGPCEKQNHTTPSFYDADGEIWEEFCSMDDVEDIFREAAA